MRGLNTSNPSLSYLSRVSFTSSPFHARGVSRLLLFARCLLVLVASAFGPCRGDLFLSDSDKATHFGPRQATRSMLD